MSSRPRPVARIAVVGAVLALVGLVWMPAAVGHGDDHRDEGTTATTQPPVTVPAPDATEEPGAEMDMEEGAAHADDAAPAVGPTGLRIRAPKHAEVGEHIRLRARLIGTDGTPVVGEPVTFLSEGHWGVFESEMVLGVARTDADGVAVLELEMRRSGDISFHAAVPASSEHPAIEAEPATTELEGNAQLYTPRIGLEVPWLGAWLIIALVLVVWGLYLLSAVRLGHLARAGLPAAPTNAVDGPARRRFLRSAVVPAGLATFITAFGGGILTIIARAPRSHGNIRSYDSTSSYVRTPFAPVHSDMEVADLPPLLDRTVSFEDDVRPILLRRGGPHAVVPKNSPPPSKVRFDTYEGLMAKEGVVIPGKPEESLLIQVLIDPAMRMPPSMPALPQEEIQVLASWIAQGAQPM